MTYHVYLVFHHPAITQIKSGLLKGDYKDRRMIDFKPMAESDAKTDELQNIIKQLVSPLKQSG